MTHTDPDAAALLRGILANPADDTARLVYADRLTENAGTVLCPRCDGTGSRTWSERIPYGGPDELATVSGPCGCGTGTVSDGFAERAEFIRVQCEMHLQRMGAFKASEDNDRRQDWLEARERELLTDARRDEWSGIKCPVCAATHWNCDGCSNTRFAPVEFRRGFVESVRCRLGDCRSTGDVLRHSHDTPSGTVYALTDWAAGVLKAHPVTRWEIVDREPTALGLYHWIWAPERVPDIVRRELGANCWRTPELARDALALAVGRVARRLAGLREVPT